MWAESLDFESGLGDTFDLSRLKPISKGGKTDARRFNKGFYPDKQYCANDEPQMCTTVLQSVRDGHLILACNRDELGTRKLAEPPKVHEFERGVGAIFPRDRDADGSWVGVNTAGIAVSLLNNYAADVRPPPVTPISRGALVPRMLQMRTMFEVVAEMERMRAGLECFRPFWLIVASIPIDSSVSAMCFTWDGERLDAQRTSLPLAQTSSSFEHVLVEENRRSQIEQLLGESGEWTQEGMDAVLGGHLPTRGATSVCMHRDDASTVSHTRIQILGDDVSLAYYDGPLCKSPEITQLTLRRR
jgi:hypothetical protein